MMMETVPSGTILHRYYRIERVLGSGGFGHVYLAIDLRTNQQYALKEYLVTGASGQEQLQHEAQMLSQLHHPNLPIFRDAFSERGRYYVVLSYIEGNDLTDLIRVTRMRNEVIPLNRLLNWIISMGDAVSFLHSHRPPVIHRDIKPDNIRIMPNGNAILVDLGNAKEAADGKRTLLFIRHQGTPGYAPPEQYPGGSGTDARSDVYALGGTLFFALTTHEPPSVSTRNQSLQQGQKDLPSLQEVLATNPAENAEDPQRSFRLGASKPAKPAPRHSRHIAQLGTLPTSLLDQLNRIIVRSMALRPDKRYQSVAEMSNDLRKVLAALPAPTPQAAAPRQADPHSTQPDLPQLYETIQAAKEQAAQRANTPSGPASATTCQRCGAIITEQATYCRVCGSPLPPPPGNVASPPASTMSSSSQRDLAEAETMEIPPQMQVQVQTKSQVGTSVAPVAIPGTQAPAQRQHNSHSPLDQPAPADSRVQAASPSKLFLPSVSSATGTQQTSQAQSSHPPAVIKPPPASPASNGRSPMQSWILIAVIVVMVMLIVLLIVLLAMHGQHHSRAFSFSRIAYSIEAQVVFHEQNFPGITATPPSAAAWLWTCCASVPAIAGITR